MRYLLVVILYPFAPRTPGMIWSIHRSQKLLLNLNTKINFLNLQPLSHFINCQTGSSSSSDDHGDLSKPATPPTPRGSPTGDLTAVFQYCNVLNAIILSSYQLTNFSTIIFTSPQKLIKNKLWLDSSRKSFIDPHHRHPCRYRLYIINTIWSVQSSGEPNGACIKMIHRRGALSALK